jgi:hypothetical protein
MPARKTAPKATAPKATPKSTQATAGPEKPAGEPVRGKLTLALLLKYAPRAASASALAKAAGLPDDESFRKAIQHHSQGSRALAPYRAKLVKADDPKTHVERKPKAETPDLTAALKASVKAAKAKAAKNA